MNSVILIGRLSRDPDVRYTQSQLAVARFTVAVDRPPRRDAQGDQPTADFIDVTAFGKTAEIIERFFTKGRWICVQGRIQNNNYTNKDGATVYTYQVVADRIEFVGKKGQDGGNGGGANAGGGFSGQSQSRGGSQDLGIPEGFSALEDDDMPF